MGGSHGNSKAAGNKTIAAPQSSQGANNGKRNQAPGPSQGGTNNGMPIPTPGQRQVRPSETADRSLDAGSAIDTNKLPAQQQQRRQQQQKQRQGQRSQTSDGS